MLEELLAEIPESVLAILRVPGLGPKRAAQLYHDLNVATLDDLRAACESHTVQRPERIRRKDGRRPFCRGWPSPRRPSGECFGSMPTDTCRKSSLYEQLPGGREITAAGSFRRGKETVGDLDFLVVTRDVDAVMDHLADFDGCGRRSSRGATRKCRCG